MKIEKSARATLLHHILKVLYTEVTHLDMQFLWKRVPKILYGIKSYSWLKFSLLELYEIIVYVCFLRLK